MIIKNNLSYMEKILNLLHNLNNEQNKINILAILRTLGSNPDLKTEIVKYDSFRRILSLLQTNDEKLIKEILFTLKYFLKDDPIASNNEIAQSTTGHYWMPFHFDNLLWKKKIIPKFIGQLRIFSKVSTLFPFLLFPSPSSLFLSPLFPSLSSTSFSIEWAI